MSLLSTSKSKSKSKSRQSKGKLIIDPEWTPSMRERFATSEGLANQAWPWTNLQSEISMLDAVVGFPPDLATRTPRAIFWTTALLSGRRLSFDAMFPRCGRTIHPGEWDAILGSLPINLSEEAFGKVIAFAAAGRSLLIEERAPERISFLRAVIEEAREARIAWGRVLDAIRKGDAADGALHGAALVDLGGGWTRIEDPYSRLAFRGVLKRRARRDRLRVLS